MDFSLEESSAEVSRVREVPGRERTGGALLVKWRDELEGYYIEMEQFGSAEPDDIFRKLSAWTARVSHMRTLIVRNESSVWAAFRTKEIDYFLPECDRQFKLWSRVFAVQSMDWNLMRGSV